MPVQVAVCGPRHCTNQDTTHAYEVGRLLARAGAVVLCGGGTGVMATAAAGADPPTPAATPQHAVTLALTTAH